MSTPRPERPVQFSPRSSLRSKFRETSIRSRQFTGSERVFAEVYIGGECVVRDKRRGPARCDRAINLTEGLRSVEQPHARPALGVTC